ncbi:hypothetical protein N7474_003594 [Penicillium riverlandense]|uniref:uncharacterized protein n=1 Tax=Penicillium riverlandense TaxID=1903569 RepID=UPI0025476206|nr:uncharacterized protein N7474_003594 [Penicillium riverlandense]KAJ5826456.1 hypothetical protein N7474_003594 [Penicillium riverlandense]
MRLPITSVVNSTQLLSTTLTSPTSTALSATITRTTSTPLLPPGYYAQATEFTVGAPPSLCKSSSYSYETKVSIPTGWIYLKPDARSGWGPEGSIWDVSAGPGAKLVDMKAQCAGSSCTAFVGIDNEEESGMMKQRADGSWYMNVTAHMETSLMVSGRLDRLDETVGRIVSQKRGESHDNKTTYPLVVSGVPPCGLPIAQNCTQQHFSGTPQQWGAYQMDDFLKSYLAKTGINNFESLRDRTMREFGYGLSELDTDCDITADDYNCPIASFCRSHPTTYETRGTLLDSSIAQFAQFLNIVIQGVKGIQSPIAIAIDEIAGSILAPAEAENDGKILGIANAFMGILVAAFIFLDLVTAESMDLIWGTLLAVGICAEVGLGGASDILALNDPESADSEFKGATKYNMAVESEIRQLESGFEALYDKNIGQDHIAQILGGGQWTGWQLTGNWSKTGFQDQVSSWFGQAMFAQYVTKALKSQGAYILFIAYGDDVPYNGKTWGFDQTTCKDNWTTDSGWEYFATCNITFGPNGTPGMSLFTRPSINGSESKSWMSSKLAYGDQTITGWDIMASSISGQQQFGFNYSLMDQNFTKLLEEGGVEGAQQITNIFTSITPDTAGLYSVPVCVVDDLVYVPGVAQVMSDIRDVPGTKQFFQTDNPCTCADVKDSFNDCSVEGFFWSPDDANQDDESAYDEDYGSFWE